MILSFFNQQAATPGAEGSEGNEDEEAPIPPTVEHIRRKDYKEVL